MIQWLTVYWPCYNPSFSACFLARTVFFSHNKSAGTVFRLIFSVKRTGSILRKNIMLNLSVIYFIFIVQLQFIYKDGRPDVLVVIKKKEFGYKQNKNNSMDLSCLNYIARFSLRPMELQQDMQILVESVNSNNKKTRSYPRSNHTHILSRIDGEDCFP